MLKFTATAECLKRHTIKFDRKFRNFRQSRHVLSESAEMVAMLLFQRVSAHLKTLLPALEKMLISTQLPLGFLNVCDEDRQM